jgi:hypothetical protein
MPPFSRDVGVFLNQLTDRSPMERPPTICPRCGRQTETATERPKFQGQKAVHWQFMNGSLVVSPRRLPTPTKCAPCNRGWAVDPSSLTLVEIENL